MNWHSGELMDADGYAAVFEKRAAEYHYAMKLVPNARDLEFEAVLEPFAGFPVGLICDMPAGGGYLAPYLPSGFGYLGVEPTSGFVLDWPPDLEKVSSGLTDVPLADASVDYLISLAGLHHEPDLRPVFAEMRRMLRDTGRVVIADVEIGTQPALFLNGFVDRNNPLGHDGHFLNAATGELLKDSGFAIRDDQILDVPWSFDSTTEAGEFCRHLFGVSSLDADGVADALEREIGIDRRDGRISLNWKLRRIVCDPV